MWISNGNDEEERGMAVVCMSLMKNMKQLLVTFAQISKEYRCRRVNRAAAMILITGPKLEGKLLNYKCLMTANLIFPS